MIIFTHFRQTGLMYLLLGLTIIIKQQTPVQTGYKSMTPLRVIFFHHVLSTLQAGHAAILVLLLIQQIPAEAGHCKPVEQQKI